MHTVEQIEQTTQFIQKQLSQQPVVGLILGSGLGTLADDIEHATVIPYTDIPGFAKSGAVGHANELVIGELQGKVVLAMKGRFHYYEGFTMDEVTFPVRVMKALGIETLIVTNACGAINKNFEPGQLMLIEDHINLTGQNPLIGPNNDALGTRFPDMSNVYDQDLRALAQSVAASQGFTLQQGVYAWWSGPTYETPAEIRMMRAMGADAAGMSTVPEAIVARHGNMRVLGISCLTNMAAGILNQPLNHQEVIDVAAQVNQKFTGLVKGVIAAL